MADDRRTGDAEIRHYDESAASQDRYDELLGRLKKVQESSTGWIEPLDPYLDTAFDSVSQADIYRWVAPRLVEGDVLQVGGTGLVALKAIIGGAATATLVTPSQGELELTRRAATALGVSARLSTFLGFAEELPVPDDAFDVVLTEGCLHHTDVTAALHEAKRVLRAGGRFGAFDPWHARLYDVGIRVFGKRDPGVDCRPLNRERISKLHEIFPVAQVTFHGALARYPIIAADKMGLHLSRATVHRIILRDDAISWRFERLRRNGSTVSVTAEVS